MGPPESPTGHLENQEGRPKRLTRRPRTRCCLLKGCEQHFHPSQARQRYCSERCREAARKWSRWKAQQTYRASMASKQKRNDQSVRYRQRVLSRKPPEPEVVEGPARVITPGHSFRSLLRPARLLRRIRACRPKSLTMLLVGALWSVSEIGNGGGNRRAFNPEILIRRRRSPYI
jgi:hypothetical protein